MFRSFFVFITILILISACTPALQATPQPDQPTSTSSPLPTATPTRTALPSTTPTASITPLPTIPIFTPTFDVSTIVTVTPVPKAECPQVVKIENPDLSFFDFSFEQQENRGKDEENILNFLNNYGPRPLVKALQSQGDTINKDYAFLDLTNDEVQEFAVRAGAFYIFGCRKGIYETLLILPPDGYLMPLIIFSTKDNNRNGIPEITLLTSIQSQGARTYQLFEWNGDNFHNLLVSEYQDSPEAGEIYVEVTGNIFYQDSNHDAVNELILDSGIPLWTTYRDGLPWRNKRTIYQWNGQSYAPTHYEFATPEFRFQAIQDGDLATNQSEFDKALSLYQDAIFSDKLKYYSTDIQKNLQDNWMAQVENARPTPTPYPSDLTEYPRLAAYAYYRIMLVHLVQGHESDANTVYNTLQEKFSNDQYGRSYVEMATAFWDVHQSTHKMYDGCAAAIQYAAEHPDILIPLGSDYHGWQSHQYKPEDVCPFR